jgi:hypothetical protein
MKRAGESSRKEAAVPSRKKVKLVFEREDAPFGTTFVFDPETNPTITSFLECFDESQPMEIPLRFGVPSERVLSFCLGLKEGISPRAIANESVFVPLEALFRYVDNEQRAAEYRKLLIAFAFGPPNSQDPFFSEESMRMAMQVADRLGIGLEGILRNTHTNWLDRTGWPTRRLLKFTGGDDSPSLEEDEEFRVRRAISFSRPGLTGNEGEIHPFERDLFNPARLRSVLLPEACSTQAEFEEQFYGLWPEMRKVFGVKWPDGIGMSAGFVVAGGSVEGAVFRRYRQPIPGQVYDVDIFVYGHCSQCIKTAHNLLKRYLSTLLSGNTPDVWEVKYPNVTTLVPERDPEQPGRQFQIVKTSAKSAYAVVQQFDMSYCRVFFDGKHLRCAPEWLQAIRDARVICKDPCFAFQHPNRIRKAFEKGYEPVGSYWSPETVQNGSDDMWNFCPLRGTRICDARKEVERAFPGAEVSVFRKNGDPPEIEEVRKDGWEPEYVRMACSTLGTYQAHKRPEAEKDVTNVNVHLVGNRVAANVAECYRRDQPNKLVVPLYLESALAGKRVPIRFSTPMVPFDFRKTYERGDDTRTVKAVLKLEHMHHGQQLDTFKRTMHAFGMQLKIVIESALRRSDVARGFTPRVLKTPFASTLYLTITDSSDVLNGNANFARMSREELNSLCYVMGSPEPSPDNGSSSFCIGSFEVAVPHALFIRDRESGSVMAYVERAVVYPETNITFAEAVSP